MVLIFFFFFFADPPCCQTFNYRFPSQASIKQYAKHLFQSFNGFKKINRQIEHASVSIDRVAWF